MSEHDAHTSFIKTPRQLIVVILLAFLVPVIGIALVVQLIVSRPSADPAAMAPEAVSARIRPVAKFEVGTPPAAPPAQGAKPEAAAQADGKKVYGSLCVACHAQSVAGSPPLGNKAAWAPRLQQGTGALVQSVIKGKGAMPPRAGNPGLSDAEIRAAVEFMVSQAR